MRPLLPFLLAIVLPLLHPAAAKPIASGAGCPFKDKERVAVEGIARSIKSGAQEPNESINTYFFLDTSGPPCGKQRISVFATGVIPCIDGDKAKVRGTYYAPSAAPFDTPMIDLATATCEPHAP